MRIAFYSVVYNHHQSLVADELYKILGKDYTFIELKNLQGEAQKGGSVNSDTCPYLIQAWKSPKDKAKAMEIALSADACIFGGIETLPYIKARLKKNLLTFEMSERWLKKGWINLLSPNIFRNLLSYHILKWDKKPYYKLCCSGFSSEDQYRLGTFKGKCYKWGYFTKVNENLQTMHIKDHLSIMWCSRFLKLKHPELPILMAKQLKDKGYKFTLNMYGSGEKLNAAKKLVLDLKIMDVVKFIGTKANEKLLTDMQQHDIFLFTSDRNEGWGAVANESMSNGCVLVTSNAIGSTPYLVKNKITGLVFQSSKTKFGFSHNKCTIDKKALESLTNQVEWLIRHPYERQIIAQNAHEFMCKIWSPSNAAKNLLELINCFINNKNCSIKIGPGSPA